MTADQFAALKGAVDMNTVLIIIHLAVGLILFGALVGVGMVRCYRILTRVEDILETTQQVRDVTERIAAPVARSAASIVQSAEAIGRSAAKLDAPPA